MEKLKPPDNDLGCWPYELMQIILDMRKTYDQFQEFLEEFSDHNQSALDSEVSNVLGDLLPIVNKYPDRAAVIVALMATCGRMLEDVLDGYAQRRMLDKIAAK